MFCVHCKFLQAMKYLGKIINFCGKNIKYKRGDDDDGHFHSGMDYCIDCEGLEFVEYISIYCSTIRITSDDASH